jgi:oxygen-independent coproporphyrinogen-3 oxidase
MDSADYALILDTIADLYDLADDAEITTEANPETLTPAHCEQIRATGVNRLSMGMQSASERVLRTLDRPHTLGRVRKAVGWARQAGFENLSLDLIYGTPGETMEDWLVCLDEAIDLQVEHISAYSLIVEENTPLARRIAAHEVDDVDEDDVADKYICADERLSAAGFEWYEVSNWARPGYECRHNLAYWHCDSWLGIGAGAHSYDGRYRWWNPRHPLTYVSEINSRTTPAKASDRSDLIPATPSDSTENREELTETQIRMEKVMLGLRLVEGVEADLLTESELKRVDPYLESGHLVRRGSSLACTLQGRLIADGIVREILD